MTRVEQVLGQFLDRAEALADVVDFWRPLPALPSPLAPIVAVSAALTAGLLAGIAVGAMVILLVVLVALQFLMTEVLGLTIETNRR